MNRWDYEILTEKQLYNCYSDEGTDALIIEQNRVFRETLYHDPYEGCGVWLINGISGQRLFYGNVSEMFDAYVEKDGADLVRFEDGFVGYNLMDCGIATQAKILAWSKTQITEER